jgi:hypothetical protein|tara:strand:+ start:646 stop:1224 length:579 start_codon:yes stop_codon:yes gene_type:complete
MIDFNFPILTSKFEKHKELKDTLLTLIEEQQSGNLKQVDSYYTDSISKLDWDRKRDDTRPWTKIILKDLMDHFETQVKRLGLRDVRLYDLWFQQYSKEDTHGWHVHGENFTGVYYLELKEAAPKTQIIEPTTSRLITVDAQEGDVVIFPSMFIHRAPTVIWQTRKTIISFNFSCDNVDQQYLQKIVDLYGLY